MAEPLMIETERQLTKAQASEITNIMFQARRLLKKPEKKLKDFYKFNIGAAIFCVLYMLLCWIFILWAGQDFMLTVCIGMLILMVVFLVIVDYSMLKMRKELLKRGGKVTLVLDEEGVFYDDHDTKSFKVNWKGILFVREFREILCFFPTDLTGIIICLENDKAGLVKDYIRECGIKVKVID